jgi:hypothetical protein
MLLSSRSWRSWRDPQADAAMQSANHPIHHGMPKRMSQQTPFETCRHRPRGIR